MGKATIWVKSLLGIGVVLVVTAGSVSPPAPEVAQEPGSYGLVDVTSRESVRDVLTDRGTGTVSFIITADEGAKKAADISVTPPTSFSAVRRYAFTTERSAAELRRMRTESQAEHGRLHRSLTLPAVIRVPVAQLTGDDRFMVRASTLRGADFCGSPGAWYLQGGTCGSHGAGRNQARCTAVHAGRIVDADVGSHLSACEVDRSDLRDALCPGRRCGPRPSATGHRKPPARHGKAQVVTGLRNDTSLSPRRGRAGDLVTFTITGGPGDKEADVMIPADRPALSGDCGSGGYCPPRETSRKERRRLPLTFTVPASEIARNSWSDVGGYALRATTILNLSECPQRKGVMTVCSFEGMGENRARCVATFRGRVVDADLDGTFATCQLDANDLKAR
jgi:hypothetical protein